MTSVPDGNFAALRLEQEKFRVLAEQSVAGVYIIQGDRLAYVNPRLAEIFGYTTEELIHERTAIDVAAPEDRELVASNIRRRLNGEIPSLHYGFTGLRKDGTRIRVEAYGSRTDIDHQPAIIGTLIDVTERYQTEQALRRSEQNFRLLTETSSDMISRHRPDGIVTFVSPASATLLGYAPEELLGGQAADYVHPDDIEKVWARIHAGCAAGDTYLSEHRMRTKSGQYIWIETAGRFIKEARTGEVQEILCFTRDVTERKRAEEALRQAELKYRSLVENIPAITYLATPDDLRSMLFVTPQVEMLGYPRNEWTLQPDLWRQLLHPEDRERVLAEARHSVAAGAFHCEYRLMTRGGQELWFRDDAVAVRDASGQPLYMQGVLFEITGLKLAETAVRAVSARLLNSQEEEQRRIARELHDTTGQNLTAIGMNLNVLKAAVPQTNTLAAQALAECLRLTSQSIREIRTFSYLLHPPVLDELGLARALYDYAVGFQQRSGIKVELDLGTDAGSLPGEIELTLFRVVQESLGNVHRHSGSRTASIRMWRDGREVWLEIQDSGKGLPAELLKAEPAGEPRVGVGLAGMSERMKQLGGRLNIRSGPEGTTIQAIAPVNS